MVQTQTGKQGKPGQRENTSLQSENFDQTGRSGKFTQNTCTGNFDSGILEKNTRKVREMCQPEKVKTKYCAIL